VLKVLEVLEFDFLELKTWKSLENSHIFEEALKGIVHFEIIFWYILAYLKGIQDVGLFFSHSIFNVYIFRSNRCCLSVI